MNLLSFDDVWRESDGMLKIRQIMHIVDDTRTCLEILESIMHSSLMFIRLCKKPNAAFGAGSGTAGADPDIFRANIVQLLYFVEDFVNETFTKPDASTFITDTEIVFAKLVLILDQIGLLYYALPPPSIVSAITFTSAQSSGRLEESNK